MNGKWDRGVEWWDRFFLGMGEYMATASRDPSTKVGAVIIDEDRRVVACAYNGFPRGCDDDPALYADRARKYRRVVHAERNALVFACRSVKGCTLYTTPFGPCAACAALFIQAGIARVVAPEPTPEIRERWGEELAEAAALFAEAGVRLNLIPRGQESE